MQNRHLRNWALAGSCAVGLSVLAWSSFAEDASTLAPAAEAMTQEQMMAKYMSLAQPGPEHQALAGMEGTFTAQCTNYCDPSQAPQTSTGTHVGRMILGGRFLHTQYDGQFMGMPFQGAGLTGYDNAKKKYIGLWIDSMSTAWMTSEGQADESGKVITLTGSYDDPVQGKTITMRQVTTLVDKDHFNFEMFGPGPDGAEMKLMEIKYTRQ